MVPALIKILAAVARPDVAAIVRAVLGVLARGKHLVNERGEAYSADEVAALWTEARAEFALLGDEAAASNAALGVK